MVGPTVQQRFSSLGLMELTTVADDLAIFHDGIDVHRHGGLAPSSEHELHGITFRTLDRPSGEMLARVTTVNDVHFGEVEAGRVDDHLEGPIQRVEAGEPPYPETMNRAAVAEMYGIGPDAVIVKGDLSRDGADDEWAAFESCYREVFGERLYVARGNHDAYRGQTRYAGDQWIELPGVAIGLLDTAIPGQTTGTISSEQLEWLSDTAASADRPVIVMGHHQQWVGQSSGGRSDGYFGLHPDASDGLDAVCERQQRIIAYTAGHTHRHRVRPMTVSGLPSIEVGCTKDFPGTWAEYRVYEGGVMQVVHRMSTPEALSWSERCRHLYADFGIDYETYALGTLGERCFVIPLR